jgi:flagellar motor switch/type III secretory pathway protein FliN
MPETAVTPDPSATLNRLLRIRVPVIVQLARRTMPLASVRQLSPGAIIESTMSVEHELALLVNNHEIARGVCVKVGENFGLRITQTTAPARRAAALRRGD